MNKKKRCRRSGSICFATCKRWIKPGSTRSRVGFRPWPAIGALIWCARRPRKTVKLLQPQPKNALEPQWRSFFELHFMQELAYGDVAKHMGITKIRCKYMKKVLLMRARRDRRLSEALGRYKRSGDEHAP